MIVYPDDNYNSFISCADARSYFTGRLYSDEFNYASLTVQEAALITAFRSINELDVTIDPTESAEFQAVKEAQCEQALYELKIDLDQQFSFLGIPNLQMTRKEKPRYSERTLAILRPYMTAPTITVTR